MLKPFTVNQSKKEMFALLQENRVFHSTSEKNVFLMYCRLPSLYFKWVFVSTDRCMSHMWSRRRGLGKVGGVIERRGSLGTLCFPSRCKGDYGFNVFHNSNPQHGGSYARHERRMRDEEVEDFLKSVKGWVPVWSSDATITTTTTAMSATGMSTTVRDGEGASSHSLSLHRSDPTSATEKDLPPDPSPLQFGDEAIMKTFTFTEYKDAYQFMGRLWAFCYGSDKYPHVVWKEKDITVYLYSPSFKGLSKREARVAAFLNDQFNMLKKSAIQREKVKEGVVRKATVEEMMGEAVRRALEEREARRGAPVKEVMTGPQRWERLLREKKEEDEEGRSYEK